MAVLADIILTPLSLLYGAVLRARNALYDTGLLTTHRIAAPVISVGNLTVGGTGKTPLVKWVARAVAATQGTKPCVLTRGYGRRSPADERVIVSDGTQLMADAFLGGDEPRLLAEELLGMAAVVADADRVAAARWAMKHLGSSVFILDDAYQHRRLARSLNLLVLDAIDPWSNKWVLPRGRLREPLAAALARADCVVITRAEQCADLTRLTVEARSFGAAHVPIIASRMEISAVRPLGETKAASVDRAQPVGVFCAIGNPQSFVSQLRLHNYNAQWQRFFRDHHYYTQTDVDSLVADARRRNLAALFTTAKDAVKLRQFHFPVPCFVVDIDLKFQRADQELLIDLIRQTLIAENQKS